MSDKNPNQLPVAGELQDTDKFIVQQDTTNAAVLADLKTYVQPDPYNLPVASDTVLGGVKIGSGLTIEDDGTVNALVGPTLIFKDPSDITGLKSWYDLTDLSTLTTDASLNIASILDKSGNSNTLIQTTAGKKPTLVLEDSINGKPALYITPGKSIGIASLIQALPYTIYVFMRQVSFESNARIVELGDDFTNAIIQYVPSDGGTMAIAMAAGVNFQPKEHKTYKTAWTLYRFSNVGGDLIFAMNDGPVTNNVNFRQTIGSTAISKLSVGAEDSLEFYMQELLLLDHNPTESDHAKIANYFIQKYNPETPINIEFHGDSITNGALADSTQHKYTNLVADHFGWDLYNWGITSTAVGYAGAGVAGQNLIDFYKGINHGTNRNGYVCICYGANEATLDVNWEQYVETVIEYFINLGYSKNKIVIISQLFIPGGNNGIDGAEVHIINVKNLTQIKFADCYAYGVIHSGPDSLIASGPHPNTAGHAAMANNVIIPLLT